MKCYVDEMKIFIVNALCFNEMFFMLMLMKWKLVLQFYIIFFGNVTFFVDSSQNETKSLKVNSEMRKWNNPVVWAIVDYIESYIQFSQILRKHTFSSKSMEVVLILYIYF